MLWIISSLVFILLRVAPGDPVDAILGADDVFVGPVVEAKPNALPELLKLVCPRLGAERDEVHNLAELHD